MKRMKTMIDLEKLLESGEINRYFYDQAVRNLQYLDEDMQQVWIEEAMAMTDLGVNSMEEQKNYHYISLYVPDILKDLFGGHVAKTPEIIAEIYRNNYKIDTLINLWDSVAVAATKFGLPVDAVLLDNIERRKKTAYPQDWRGAYVAPVYNLSKWIHATRDIYSRVKKGEPFNAAFDAVTLQWGKMEKIDFKHWMKFYQEGAHQKYKIARMIPSTEGGYHVPVRYDDLFSRLPNPIMHEPSIPDPRERRREDVNNVRERVESQRSKIISRLNAAEKLLASLDGQLFAGDDQEIMLRLLQDLKRKVQTANKITLRSSLFEDYIYQTGNYLKDMGKKRASNFFFKIAQGLPLPTPPADIALPGMDQPAPTAPTAPSTQTDNTGAKAATHEAFKEFFSLLETGVIDIDDDELKNNKTAEDDAFIVVEAQPAPEEEIPKMNVPQKSSNVDEVIESALNRVTIQDVINELEILSGLFKKREIARRLSIVDLMMDRLGIGAFFPSLGESLRSALESNQYVSTRIEDVLSKLRGSIEHVETDEILEGKEEITPENAAIRRNLEEQQEKERERHERRREREEQRAEKQEQQQQQIAPEFAGPAAVETARPVPVR